MPNKSKTKRQYYKLFTNPPDNPTYYQLMDWLADTGWIEGRVRKIISSLDLEYLDDYIQEVWIQILEVPIPKMMDIWKKGKGKFCNYIKSIIVNNVISTQSNLYKNIRRDRKNEVYLDSIGWSTLDDSGEAEVIEQQQVIRESSMFQTKSREFEYIPVKVHAEEQKYQDVTWEI